jgi:hypothetical protein
VALKKKQQAKGTALNEKPEQEDVKPVKPVPKALKKKKD